MATSFTETEVELDYAREKSRLLRLAEEKPTLRMINADKEKTIDAWKGLYLGMALFIQVTSEDASQVFAGKLIATAESSIEFLDLDREYQRIGAVTLTTYGKSIDPRPIPLPPIFWLGTELE